jgi:hypothetical protein
LSVKLGSCSTNVGSLTTTVTLTKRSPKETLAATLENFFHLPMHLSNKQVSILVVTFQPSLTFFAEAKSLSLSVILGTCSTNVGSLITTVASTKLSPKETLMAALEKKFLQLMMHLSNKQVSILVVTFQPLYFLSRLGVYP